MRSASAGPCVLVIFGAGGDLTKRLLIPTLYNLRRDKRLPDQFAVVGFARTDVGGEEGFRQKVQEALKEFVSPDFDTATASWLEERFFYVRSAFDNQPGYGELRKKLEDVDAQHGTGGNYLFYLATAPEFFAEVPKQLDVAGLTKESEGYWRRLIIEKPFGRDLPSAKQLNQDLGAILQQSQIYRIDHYLGKETVQNIMVLRFGNGIFEPIWNRRYIDHIQITVAETVGVETRGGYYETAGALRDMVPNHIMQLLALAAMEPPNSFSANAVREEQSKVLQAVQRLSPEEVSSQAVRGQYGAGTSGGKPAPAYRDEDRVAKDSSVETFVAMKLMVDNWRWSGVPFYFRTGKRMTERTTEMTVQFRQAPFVLFRDTPVEQLISNRLVLQLQPNEGISLEIEAKEPGPEILLKPVEMKFSYADYFGKSSRTGYETLIFDCMIGDPTLFKTAEAVEEGWAIVEPVMQLWGAKKPSGFPNYSAGSWGPSCSDELLAKDGRHWRKETNKQ